MNLYKGVFVCAAVAPFLACSPVYVFKSAAGHGGLLWRRQSIAKALADERTPKPLKQKLTLVRDIRSFAFQTMALKPSRDYTTFTKLDRSYVTVLVTASEKTRFRQYQWWFPFVGRVPYKGHFSKEDALRERSRLEKKGYDVYLGQAAAYNTPLWFSDPLPSPVLDYSPGGLASLLIHEFVHGTIFIGDEVGFNESLAEYIGNQGAEEFLTRRYGSDSAELREFREDARRESDNAAVFNELYARLEALYQGGQDVTAKLKEREVHFAWGARRFKAVSGRDMQSPLNNAVILAHRLYHEDHSDFAQAYERCGRDWKKAIAYFKSLDKKDPRGDLKRKLSAS